MYFFFPSKAYEGLSCFSLLPQVVAVCRMSGLSLCSAFLELYNILGKEEPVGTSQPSLQLLREARMTEVEYRVMEVSLICPEYLKFSH